MLKFKQHHRKVHLSEGFRAGELPLATEAESESQEPYDLVEIKSG